MEENLSWMQQELRRHIEGNKRPKADKSDEQLKQEFAEAVDKALDWLKQDTQKEIDRADYPEEIVADKIEELRRQYDKRYEGYYPATPMLNHRRKLYNKLNSGYQPYLNDPSIFRDCIAIKASTRLRKWLEKSPKKGGSDVTEWEYVVTDAYEEELTSLRDKLQESGELDRLGKYTLNDVPVSMPLRKILSNTEVPYDAKKLRGESKLRQETGTFNGLDFWPIYAEAFQRGQQEFIGEYKRYDQAMYTDHGAKLATTLLNKYNATGWLRSRFGWRRAKYLFGGIPFRSEYIADIGYYCGLCYECEQFMQLHAVIFDELKNKSTESRHDAKTFEELFHDPINIEPAVDILRSLYESQRRGKLKSHCVIGEGRNFTGGNKYVFGIWLDALRERGFIRHEKNTDHLASLLSSYFDGLSITGRTLRSNNDSKTAGTIEQLIFAQIEKNLSKISTGKLGKKPLRFFGCTLKTTLSWNSKFFSPAPKPSSLAWLRKLLPQPGFTIRQTPHRGTATR